MGSFPTAPSGASDKDGWSPILRASGGIVRAGGGVLRSGSWRIADVEW